MRDDTFPDETLMAVADGEADDQTARAVAEAVAVDPTLRARLATFERTRETLRSALRPLEAVPVPPVLEAAVRARVAAANRRPTALGRARPPSAWGPGRPRIAAMALAASLALVIGGLGGYALRQEASPSRTTALDVPAALGQALDSVAAGQTHRTLDGTSLRVVASFRDGSGRLCREAVTRDALGSADLVLCHDGEAWRLRFAVARPDTEASFAPAGADEALDVFLGAIDAGPTLSAEEEADALARLR